MKACAILLAVVAGTLAGRADFIYNVDFENPPHVLGSPVVTGAGSDVPSSTTGNVIVRDSLGDFTNQLASFESGGGMSFNPSGVFTAGLVFVRWDLAMLATGGVEPEQGVVTLDPEPASGGSSLVLHFMIDGDIEFNGMDIGTYTLGVHDQFQISMDLDNDHYSLFINGSQLLTNEILASDWSPDLLGFGTGFLASPDYAVDNFQWGIIPEPSTAILLGALGLAVGRPRKDG